MAGLLPELVSRQGYLRIPITHLPDVARLVSELARKVRQVASGELRTYLN